MHEVFDDEIVSALYYLFLIQQGVKLDTTLFVEEHQLSDLAQALVLQQFCLQKTLFTGLQVVPSLLDKKGDRFSYQTLQTSQFFMLLEQYGQSPVRLSFLIHQNLDTEMIVLYHLFLRQLRNGARYCFVNVTKPLTLKDAQKQFEKKADAFDIRIMKEFFLLWEECNLTPSFPLVQQFVQRKFL